MTGRAVMVLCTTSHSGKSWLATALCRWSARQGLKVSPFERQNMSNNARFVPGLNGSPAEFNLHASDYVNLRTACEAQAACLPISDVDRGGAFADLFGRHQLLPADERALIRVFVLNRFRGDAGLLAPGPRALLDREPRTLDSVFADLADFINRPFEPGALTRLAQP